MRILFDHGTPAPLRYFLSGHEVIKAKDAGWDRLANGELLAAAEAAGFQLLLTADKNIRYQQNLSSRRIAIIVLGNSPWPVVKQHVQAIVAAVDAAAMGSYTEVEIPLPPKKLYRQP